MTSLHRFPVSPPRLVSSSGRAADVLREVSNEVDSASREARAWERLEARLEDAEGRGWPVAWLPAAGAAVLAVVLLIVGLTPSSWSLSIAPERNALVAVEPVQPTRQPAVVVMQPETSTQKDTGQAERSDPATLPQPSAEAPQRDCLGLARKGSHGEALACFENQARGSGMDAELAQYELGRLRRNIQGDTAGAIRAYRMYLSRFPQGAFRTEASVSLAELLFASGNHRAALAESERMLSNGTARERAPELRLLRARTYQRQLGDCERARAEYARLTSQPGAIGEAARRGLAECEAVEPPEPQTSDPPTEPEATQVAPRGSTAAFPLGVPDKTPTTGPAEE